MTSNQVKDLIDEELKSEPNLTSVSGLELTKCLMLPIKQTYLLDNSEKVKLYSM